jgi:hypothetical protein
MIKYLTPLLFCLITQLSFAQIFGQKEVYLPNDFQNPNEPEGAEFTWDKTYESDNFILIWGNEATTDPLTAPDPNLQFNPAGVADTLEYIFEKFVELGFAKDIPGTNLNQYKIVVSMLNTYTASNGPNGYLYGGDYDGVIGMIGVSPNASWHGYGMAHELTHSLQNQCVIDYRIPNGLGGLWNVGWLIYEGHADFMANLLYPDGVWAGGMDWYHVETWGDWKNAYLNYALLFAIMEEDGIEAVNSLFYESYTLEYPLQTYKRLMGYTSEQFNEKMFNYVRRMATYDFSYTNTDFSNNSVGHYFRQSRTESLTFSVESVQRTWTILEQDSVMPTHYSVPIELAPEEFAYNIIPLYPDDDNCAVIVKFKGHVETHDYTGWRYGFVAAYADGTVSRYSETYDQDEMEIGFELNPDEEFLYFVVMGAPPSGIMTNSTNDTWQGYPKKFRYPYDLTISGAVPEGFQEPANFRTGWKTDGSLHPNGGGWIEDGSSAENSVYVGPYAIVRGNSVLTGNVRIENTALVSYQSNISGNVVVKDNASVDNSTVTDNVVVRGRAYVQDATLSDSAVVGMRAEVSNYNLHGDIKVGGDVIVYNDSGDCDNGVYNVMTNYWANNLLQCDGRTETHPDNLDVNNPIIPLTNAEMELTCNCDTYPDCLTLSVEIDEISSTSYFVFPNPAVDIININAPDNLNYEATIFDLQGRLIISTTNQSVIDVQTLPQGMYLIVIKDLDSGQKVIEKIIKR